MVQSRSPYVISMVKFGIASVPDLVNASIMTSVLSVGNNMIFSAARTLHGMVLDWKHRSSSPNPISTACHTSARHSCWHSASLRCCRSGIHRRLCWIGWHFHGELSVELLWDCGLLPICISIVVCRVKELVVVVCHSRAGSSRMRLGMRLRGRFL